MREWYFPSDDLSVIKNRKCESNFSNGATRMKGISGVGPPTVENEPDDEVALKLRFQ